MVGRIFVMPLPPSDIILRNFHFFSRKVFTAKAGGGGKLFIFTMLIRRHYTSERNGEKKIFKLITARSTIGTELVMVNK